LGSGVAEDRNVRAPLSVLGTRGLLHFYQGLAGFDLKPNCVQPFQELLIAAVSKSKSQEASWVIRSCGKDEKVFVFADNDSSFGKCP